MNQNKTAIIFWRTKDDLIYPPVDPATIKIWMDSRSNVNLDDGFYMMNIM